MNFGLIVAAMLGALAAGVFLRPEAAAGPVLLWLVVMTLLSCRKRHREE